jgi:hypothetical protein
MLIIGQRSRSPGQIFRWGDTPRFALPLLFFYSFSVLVIGNKKNRKQKLIKQGCFAVNIWPGDLDLWPWKSIVFQIFWRTKYVPSLVKIHWRMLILECSQGCYHPCEHSRINILQWILTKHGTYLVLRRVWSPIDFQGQRSRSPGQSVHKDVTEGRTVALLYPFATSLARG